MRFAIAGVALLLMGAVAVETVDKLVIEPRTVSSWGELVDCYLVARTTLPPLPFADADVFTKMKAGDWSFLADHWQYKQTDGSYYVSENSRLRQGSGAAGQLAKLKLPLHILVYEDLQRGEIVVLSSVDGMKYQGEALFKAPEFMPYEKDVSLDCYAFDELSPRRIIWEITLKSEADAWSDLVLQRDAAAATAMLPEGGMMAMMSVPTEHTNDIWLALETQTNGINLNVFAPENFTNRVEIYSSTDLVSGFWSVAEQNLYPSGTNPAVWDASSTLTTRFLRAGNMDIDSDGDGINDARELIVHKTNPNNSDSDGDTISDYQELYVDFTDPNNNDTSPPTVWITAPGAGKAVLP
jgi:hypothetical protein